MCSVSVFSGVKTKSEMAWQFLVKDRSPVMDLFLAYGRTDGSSGTVDWYANGSQCVTKILSIVGSCNRPVIVMIVTMFIW